MVGGTFHFETAFIFVQTSKYICSTSREKFYFR